METGQNRMQAVQRVGCGTAALCCQGCSNSTVHGRALRSWHAVNKFRNIRGPTGRWQMGLFCERANDLGGDVEEEDGCNEGEGEYEDNEWVTSSGSFSRIALVMG